MARGLRDHGARRIDAWPSHDPFVDGALEPEHRTAHVAYGGEPPHQGGLRLPRCQELKVRGIGRQEHALRGCCHEDMPVRINEPRHQHPPGRLDHVHVGVDRDGACRDTLDDVASHQHIGGRRERSAFAVEDTDVLKKRRAGIDLRGRRRLSRHLYVVVLTETCLAEPGGEHGKDQPSEQVSSELVKNRQVRGSAWPASSG